MSACAAWAVVTVTVTVTVTVRGTSVVLAESSNFLCETLCVRSILGPCRPGGGEWVRIKREPALRGVFDPRPLRRVR